MDESLFKSIDLSLSPVKQEDPVISRLERIEENQSILSEQLAQILARIDSRGDFDAVERQRLDRLRGLVSQVKAGVHDYIDTLIDSAGRGRIPKINLGANFSPRPQSARETLIKHSREFRELKKVI